MRGKAFWGIHAVICHGITPAYAGKSYQHKAVILCSGDHPRLCGEKLSDFSIIANVLGSPPPMRGKVKNVTIETR